MTRCENIIKRFYEGMKDDIEKKFKISKFEKTDPKHCVCSIGYSESNDKWYGYSHRAICGFGIGNKLFDAEWNDDGKLSEEEVEKLKFVERGSITIKNNEQAREAASNFAKYVS